MNDLTPIAKVVAITGEVYVRNENGELRLLTVDSVIYPGDRIVADSGETVELVMANGQPLVIDSNTPVTFSEDMQGETAASGEEASVEPGSIEELLGALESGEEIDGLLAAPAAGGGSNDGHSFVLLERISENVDQTVNTGNNPAAAALATFSPPDSDEPELLAADPSSSGGASTNSAPVASAANESVTEGGALFVGQVTATDADGDPLTYSLAGPAPSGLIFNPDGSYSFDPTDAAYDGLKAGETTDILVTYQVDDGQGGTDTATLTLTVTGTNDDPVANDDGPVAATEDTALTNIDVLGNDTDVDGDTLSIQGVPTALNGTVTVNANGTLNYTPNANFNGVDTITYTVSDGNGGTDTASVTVNVAAVADDPILNVVSPLTSIYQPPTSISTTAALSRAAIESQLGLANGILNTFNPPGTDPGNVNANDGGVTSYSFSLANGDSASLDWSFVTGENSQSEINQGYNDLALVVITDPNGNTQIIQLSSSEEVGPSSTGNGTQTISATMDGTYQASFIVLNARDGAKDSTLNITGTSVTSGGNTLSTASVALAIGAELTDLDGSETLSLQISGVPAGATLSAGTDLGGGIWSLTQADLVGLIFTPADGFTGTVNLTVTATATEGTGPSVSVNETISILVDQTTNTILGTPASQTLTGTSSDDSIQANAGNDTVNGQAGNDLMFGGLGNDTMSGGAGHDVISGDAGNDNLSGNAGNDTLRGGAGTDTLDGDSGNDLLIGGAGDDTLTGGAGVDTFAWELGDAGAAGSPATDVISDFNDSNSNGDVLDLRDLLQDEQNNDLTEYLHVELSGNDTLIHISTSGGFTGVGSPNPADIEQTIELTNVDLVTGFADQNALLQDLINNGKLITD